MGIGGKSVTIPSHRDGIVTDRAGIVTDRDGIVTDRDPTPIKRKIVEVFFFFS